VYTYEKSAQCKFYELGLGKEFRVMISHSHLSTGMTFRPIGSCKHTSERALVFRCS